jgi:hypothetical protein
LFFPPYDLFLTIFYRVIPQDDGLMDLWIAGLLVLNSIKNIMLDFKENFKIGISNFPHMMLFA